MYPQGSVDFWPRPLLIDKVQGAMTAAHKSHALRRGDASKLYAILNFIETGMFGRIGRAGLDPVKQRIYEGDS